MIAGIRRAVAPFFVLLVLTVSAWAGAPANVIVMIGDGMGPEHVKAAGLYANGREGSLFFESLPHRAQAVTCPAYAVAPGQDPATAPAKVTDSAAAATALATGTKVYNGVLSVALPGNGQPLPTVLEAAAKAGKRTGLVTTAYITDATPAGFAAHVKLRSMNKEIAADYLERTRPNVIFGAGLSPKENLFAPDSVKAAGYLFVNDRQGLLGLDPAAGSHYLGLFNVGTTGYEYDCVSGKRQDCNTQPHLSEMARKALDILSREPKGFFLMIEGACIDKASHKNELERAIGETVEFDKTVKLVADWAAQHPDTLILVTADHETGGLKVSEGQGAGQMPKVTWSSKGHTGVNVGVYALGPGAEQVKGVLDNTDVARIAGGTFTGPTRYLPPVAAEAAPVPAAAGD